jgi:hypothetical protein
MNSVNPLFRKAGQPPSVTAFWQVTPTVTNDGTSA